MPLFNLHFNCFYIYIFQILFLFLSFFWHSQIAIKFPFNSSHTPSWRAFSFRVELLHVAFGTLPRRVASDSYSDSHIPIGIILSSREHFCYMLWLVGLVLEPSRRRRPRQIFPVGPLLLSFFSVLGLSIFRNEFSLMRAP